MSNNLIIALSKGRIYTETLPFLESVGIIPLDDPEVYKMIRSGNILGIVQIQSRAQLQAILRLYRIL